MALRRDVFRDSLIDSLAVPIANATKHYVLNKLQNVISGGGTLALRHEVFRGSLIDSLAKSQGFAANGEWRV